MKRLAAVLILLILAVPAQARLIKEMEVTRSGKVVLAGDGKPGWYQLVMENNKIIVLGDPAFFGPATRNALDQAVERKLTVEIAGHLLVFNDQPPLFALPVKKIDVKGLAPARAANELQPAAPQTADEEPFKAARLKTNKSVTLGQALGGYAFFASRAWRVTEPGKAAEFRGELNLADFSELDTRYLDRLKSKSLPDTFRSLTFVAPVTLSGETAECPEPYVEAVLQDGTKDRLVWKEPPGYYFDRIIRNRKIKIDYFVNRAAQNPRYAKGSSTAN